jgi:hypothetical protein
VVSDHARNHTLQCFDETHCAYTHYYVHQSTGTANTQQHALCMARSTHMELTATVTAARPHYTSAMTVCGAPPQHWLVLTQRSVQCYCCCCCYCGYCCCCITVFASRCHAPCNCNGCDALFAACSAAAAWCSVTVHTTAAATLITLLQSNETLLRAVTAAAAAAAAAAAVAVIICCCLARCSCIA